MPPLSPGDLMTLGGMIVTAISAFVAVREQVKQTVSGQTEILRQVSAIHKRMDHYGERLNQAETNHAVLVERVANLFSQTSHRCMHREAEQMREDEG